jgi:hypothetical protein
MWRSSFSALIVVLLFFLPATICLVFACFVWMANKRPSITEWRLVTFQWGMILASVTTVLLLPSMMHQLITLQPAQELWLLYNRLAAALWTLCLAAALAGQRSGRVLLFCWGILLFVGVFGVDSATIP